MIAADQSTDSSATIAPPLRVLICGSRTFTNRAAIRRELSKLPTGTVIIHGDAPGADSIAGEIAEELGLVVHACSADWNLHGRAAGPIRNSTMLRDYQPQAGIAFVAGGGDGGGLEKSKGTADMVRKLRKAGVPVEVFGG